MKQRHEEAVDGYEKEEKRLKKFETCESCLKWSALSVGCLIVLIFLVIFILGFAYRWQNHLKIQTRHVQSYSEEGMEFPKIVICDNVNSVNNASAELLKHISCTLNENGLLGEERRNYSCTEPDFQKMQLYNRNCLVYGNESGGLQLQVAKSASTTLRLVVDIGTHDGRFETPWKGAFMLIQNPYIDAPPDVTAGLVRTYVLSPHFYHLVEMKRQSDYAPSLIELLNGEAFKPHRSSFQYIVNTPEVGPLSETYATRYKSQSLAVIDFQFTTLQQDNIVETDAASVTGFIAGIGGLLGYFTVGGLAVTCLVKLGMMCCCSPTGKCKKCSYCCSDEVEEAETTTGCCWMPPQNKKEKEAEC